MGEIDVTRNRNCRWVFPDMGAGGGYPVWECEDWYSDWFIPVARLPQFMFYTFAGPPAQGGGFVGPVQNQTAEQKRLDRCGKNASDQAVFKCTGKVGAPPSYENRLGINTDVWLTAAQFQGALFKSITSQDPKIPDFWTSTDPYVINTWGAAYRAALEACRTNACLAEVQLFFGQTTIALPELGPFGSVNDAVNVILKVLVSNPRFETSAANSLFKPYLNGGVCVSLDAAATKDSCSK